MQNRDPQHLFVTAAALGGNQLLACPVQWTAVSCRGALDIA